RLHAVEDLVERDSEGRCTRSHLVCNVHRVHPTGTDGRVELEITHVEGVHPCLLSQLTGGIACDMEETGAGGVHDAGFRKKTGSEAPPSWWTGPERLSRPGVN